MNSLPSPSARFHRWTEKADDDDVIWIINGSNTSNGIDETLGLGYFRRNRYPSSSKFFSSGAALTLQAAFPY